MGSAVRKKLTTEEQIANTERMIAEAKAEQARIGGSAGKVIMPPDDEVDIDDLLGDDPLPKKKKEPKSRSVLRQRTTKGIMVTFLTKEGKRITAPGVEYYVVRFNGRLHYKVAADCIELPDNWKEGDPVPGLEDVETIPDLKDEDDLL